ncbi:hypothetical protein ACFC09_05725 [Streptomyces sp. NPDC056161]|uniref:hypothetical protein n=1 Tax=Streptomyces sp. NPDC056161 TaxID=3345732 RepID=UPI0035DBD886
MDDEQKLDLIRRFLKSNDSIRGFAEKVRNNSDDDKEKRLTIPTFSRWVKDASEEVQGVVKLRGLNAEEQRDLRERRESIQPQHHNLSSHAQKIDLIRRFLGSGEKISMSQFVADLNENGKGANERNLSLDSFSRWIEEASGKFEGVVELSGLSDEERRKLLARSQENDWHDRFDGLGSSTMASIAAARPVPTRLSSSGSYGTAPRTPGAVPSPLPDFDSLASVAEGRRLPPVFSFEQAAHSGAYGTGTTPPPASFNAQGHPGYGGGGQGPARGGR